MDRNLNYIKMECTNYIKGFAIILMFFHHFFGFHDWYVNGIYYYGDTLIYFAKSMNICVGIFAFLTGYFYFFSNNKTIKNSLKKILTTWIYYLSILFIFIIIAVALKCYPFSIKSILLEIFLVDRKTLIFSWYIIFYFEILLILPIYNKLSKKNNLLLYLFPVIVFDLYMVLYTYGITIFETIHFHFSWLPFVFWGYIFAKKKLFFKLKSLITSEKSAFNCIIIFLSIVAILLLFVFNPKLADNSIVKFFLVPYILFLLIELHNIVKSKHLFFIISKIGEYSLLMWLSHCIFFNCCKKYFQPILFWSKNPLFVLLWGIILCFGFSYLVNKPIKFILNIKKNNN